MIEGAMDTVPEGPEPEAPDFLSGLSGDDRALAEENGWQGVDGVFESYRNLKEQLSNAVVLPDENAGPEASAGVYSDLAKRWTPKDGYRFAMPEALPEDFPYDQAFAEEAGGWFKEAGLHPAAAQKLHDCWLGKMSEQFAAQKDAASEAARSRADAVAKAHRELVRDYGDPGGDKYRNLVAKADRALSGLKAEGVDLSGWFADKGALTEADENGLQQVADPTAVKLLAFIHDKALAEDSLSGSADTSDGRNPFDRLTPDLRRQSALLESNPARAKQLIVSAGRDPKLFSL
jgi:hypothetical protein